MITVQRRRLRTTVQVSAYGKASESATVITVAVIVARLRRARVVTTATPATAGIMTMTTTTGVLTLIDADITATITTNALRSGSKQSVQPIARITATTVRIPYITHSISLPLTYLRKNLIVYYM